MSIFQFSNQTGFYKGKVRDVYEIAEEYLVIVASDRISAFDHILPKMIPNKGAILNTIAAKFLEMTKEVVPNWLIEVPDSRVSIGYRCETYPVEMVIRGYLCGHALREYQEGKREICGVPLPEGMLPYDPFPIPIITPSTKAKEGHDEDISEAEIISRGLVSEEEYRKLEEYTRALFAEGTEYAAERGLILADTKYEFGKRNGQIMLIDEIHTPDSSRYFYKEGFDESRSKGKTIVETFEKTSLQKTSLQKTSTEKTSPKQLSKEFVREWLMENGFQGREGEIIPEMTEEVVEMISHRYKELYKVLMGDEFKTEKYLEDNDLQAKIEKSLKGLV